MTCESIGGTGFSFPPASQNRVFDLDESGEIDFEEFVRSLNSLVGSFDQQLEFLFSLVSSIRLVHMFDHSSPARPRP